MATKVSGAVWRGKACCLETKVSVTTYGRLSQYQTHSHLQWRLREAPESLPALRIYKQLTTTGGGDSFHDVVAQLNSGGLGWVHFTDLLVHSGAGTQTKDVVGGGRRHCDEPDKLRRSLKVKCPEEFRENAFVYVAWGDTDNGLESIL